MVIDKMPVGFIVTVSPININQFIARSSVFASRPKENICHKYKKHSNQWPRNR